MADNKQYPLTLQQLHALRITGESFGEPMMSVPRLPFLQLVAMAMECYGTPCHLCGSLISELIVLWELHTDNGDTLQFCSGEHLEEWRRMAYGDTRPMSQTEVASINVDPLRRDSEHPVKVPGQAAHEPVQDVNAWTGHATMRKHLPKTMTPNDKRVAMHEAFRDMANAMAGNRQSADAIAERLGITPLEQASATQTADKRDNVVYRRKHLAAVLGVLVTSAISRAKSLAPWLLLIGAFVAAFALLQWLAL